MKVIVAGLQKGLKQYFFCWQIGFYKLLLTGAERIVYTVYQLPSGLNVNIDVYESENQLTMMFSGKAWEGENYVFYQGEKERFLWPIGLTGIFPVSKKGVKSNISL